MTKRVLLDEGVPRHLAEPLDAAGVFATPYPNAWKQITNGELLTLAERQGFDILVTNDKNMSAQQNLRGRNIAIIVLPHELASPSDGTCPTSDNCNPANSAWTIHRHRAGCGKNA